MSTQRLPVTPEQRGMFLHHALHTGDPSLNAPFAYEITRYVEDALSVHEVAG